MKSVTMLRLLKFLSPDTNINFFLMSVALVSDLNMCLAGFTNLGNLRCTASCNLVACEIVLSIMDVSAERRILNSAFSTLKFRFSEILELVVAAVRVVK